MLTKPMGLVNSAVNGFLTMIGVNDSVDKVFDQHQKNVERTKSELIRHIDEWGKDMIEKINEYMEKEKSRLDHHYNNCLKHLASSRQEYKGNERDFKDRHCDEELQGLLNLCRGLKFELGTIAKHQQAVIYVGVQLKGEFEDQNANTDKKLVNGSDSSSQRDDLYHDCSSDESSGKTSLTNAEKCSKFDQTNQQSLIRQGMEHLSCCPRCFMIFPPNLNENDRIFHITAHDS